MYASLLLGLGSHKECTNALLRFYYWKPVLFLACAGTEVWYMSLFVLAHTEGPVIFGGLTAFRAVYYVCSPVCVFKQVANAVQLYVACQALVDSDMKGEKSPHKK